MPSSFTPHATVTCIRDPAAFDFLKKFDPATPDGRIDLDGDWLFALVQSYTTKAAAELAFEAHRQFLDIQFVAAGAEIIPWAPVETLVPRGPYDAARDFTAYDGLACAELRCTAGMFAVFFPEHGHMPRAMLGATTLVKKVVIKARV